MSKIPSVPPVPAAPAETFYLVPAGPGRLKFYARDGVSLTFRPFAEVEAGTRADALYAAVKSRTLRSQI